MNDENGKETSRSGKNAVIWNHDFAAARFSESIRYKVGGSVADLLPYERFDSYKAFTWVSVHHITEALIALAVIMILSKLLMVGTGYLSSLYSRHQDSGCGYPG